MLDEAGPVWAIALRAGAITSGAGGTRVVQTNPPGVVQNCLNLPTPGSNARVKGAADDPNPQGVAGRDVVYFALENTSTGERWVKKVAGDCSGVLDEDYGNQNGSWNWGTIVGMAVDEATGDLYIASPGGVEVVHPDETVEMFKAGFASVLGIDVYHPVGSAYGLLLVADNGASAVKAVPLDNPSAPFYRLPQPPLLER